MPARSGRVLVFACVLYLLVYLYLCVFLYLRVYLYLYFYFDGGLGGGVCLPGVVECPQVTS